jgi:hypothetical protein
MLILAAGGGRSEPDMSEELFAISKIPPAPAAQGDYDSICAALMHTERGRWFLQEYARRNRSADTQLLLAAIERIEAVVCAERNKQAQQGFRSDLLEMAKAITRTRAEVAEIKTDALRAELAQPDTPPPPKTRDVFAAAERIQDVTWAMRGHGFDPSTCDQLEELAGTILSASSLRDPTDHRASKLSEVLQYLEHRIDTLLESSQDGDATASEPAPAPDPAGFGPELAGDAEPTNGFAGPLASAEPELAGDVEASPASPPAPPNRIYDVAPLVAADAGLESEAEAEAVAVVEVEVEAKVEVEVGAKAAPGAGAPATDAGPPLPTGEAAEGPPEPLIATQDREVEAQAASETASAPQSPVGAVESPVADLVAAAPAPTAEDDTAEIVADTEPAVAASVEPGVAVAPSDDFFLAQAEAPAAATETAGEGAPQWSPSLEDGTAAPQDALLPRLELSDGSLLPMARSQTPARAILPEIDLRAELPGFGTAAASAAPLTAMLRPEALAAPPEPARPALEPAPNCDGAWLSAPDPTESGGARPEPMPAALAELIPVPLLAAAAPMQPAADAAMPPGGDPLAAVKAMSEDELIALFS